MIKNKLGGKRSGKRMLAMFLAVLMVVTATDFSTVLGVQAKSNDTRTITGFTALADNIKEQQVPLGTVEEDLNLPDTLTVTVEKEVLEEVTEPQESVSGNDTEATTEAGIIPTTESGTETETISETETKVEETTETSNDAVTVETEEVTLEGITWELDAEASAKETFDGGITPEEYFGVTEDGKPDYASATQEKRDAYEDMNGAYYTYKPVIPEEYTVADGVELPEIIVMVGENQISMMTLDSTTFDVANGQILIQAGTNDTNKIVVTQNGDTTAELSSDTNITITGTDMEASAASGSGFVYVDGVTANITFDNLKLGLTGGYGSNFKAASNSKITLTLVGENTFTNKLGTYGFNAGKTGSTTTIKGSGSLDVAAESAMYVRDCTIQGGTVKTQSSVSYGIQGGGYLTILGSDTIVQAEATTTKSTTQSGILVTGNLTISDGATVTGISTSGRGIQTQQASGQVGSILFENAHITAKGATDGIYSIDCPLTIKGGMVEATAMTETPIDTDSITITGGSIKSMDQKGTVSYLTGDTIKNEAGTVVTGRTLTLVKDVNTGGTISEKATSNTAITSLNFSGDTSYTYGTTGMKTDEEGRLYVYLPEGVFVSSVVTGTGTSQEVYELVGEAGESSVYKAKMEQEAFSINGDTDRLHYGDTSKDTFTLETTGGSGSGKVTYEITEGSDAAEVVADTGVVTTKKAGSFTITATKAGDETYKSITATKTFTVQTAVARVTLANGSKTDYGSLEAAITEAQKTENSGCKVTLLDNVDITSKITVTSKFTLDLNGKTAKRADNYNWQSLPIDALFYIGDGGDLTVEDTGTGGTIKRDDNYGGSVLELYSGGCLTVNSGNIVGNGYAIYQTSASTLGTAVGKITLNGGSVTATDTSSGRAVYAYNLEITGGTYTGVTALQASHNNAKIELCGGTFIGTVSTKSAQAPSVASLLAPGYAFKKDGAWVNDTTVTSLSGTSITVELAPVKITTQPTAPATLKYGETATLTVGTDVTEGVSYQWYLDNSENAIDGEVSASYTTSNTLSVGEHTFVCKVTKDGYTVAATPVTITVGQAEGIVSDLTITGWTYGSSLEDTNKPSSTSRTNTGVTPVYEYKLTAEGDTAYSGIVPTDAGAYTVRVTYPETTNYTAASKTTDFTIKKKSVTPSITGTASKTYDGTNTVKAGDVSISLTGVITEDTANVNATATFAYDSVNAGENITVNATDITLAGTKSSNYALSKIAASGSVGTIIQATGTLTVPTSPIKKTFGDDAFSLGCTTNGDGKITYEVKSCKNTSGVAVANDKVVTVDASGNATIVGAGTATINVNMAATTNYTEASKTISVTVDKKELLNESVIRSYAVTAGSGDTPVTINIAEAGNLSTATDRGTTSYTLASVTDDNSILVAGSCSVNPETGVLTYKVDKDKAIGNRAIIPVTVSMENYADYTYTLTIQIVDKTVVELKPGTEVAINGSNVLTYGDALSKLTFQSAVFVEQGTDKEVAGTLAWTDSTEIPEAGTITAAWTYTPANENVYEAVTGTVAISVSKATPTVETPTVTGFTYDPGKTLNDVAITSGTNSVAGTWAWKSKDTVPTVGNSGYTAVFTPSNTANYNTVEKTVTVAVAKATPVVNVLPTASTITYGQTLGDSTLTGGTAQYSSADGAPAVDGVYTWTTGTTKPAFADSDETEYSVTFTPADATNYNSFAAKITLTVNKATKAPNVPESTMAPVYTIKTVGDISLPSDWQWNETDVAKALTVGEAVKATAIYNGTDKGNYEKESVEVTITREACTHSKKTLVVDQEATCTTDGSGHYVCEACGKTVEENVVIKAKGHTWGEWKVTTAATYDKEGVETRECSVCHEKETRAIAKLTKPAEDTKPTENTKPADNTPTKDYAIKGKTYTVSKMKFKVASVASDGTGTVTYTGTTKSKNSTSVNLGSTVKINGKTFKITAIGDKAFKNFKKLKKVTIGANVTSIGKEAFYGCKALKTITIKSKKLKKVGKNAIKNIYKKATIKVPSSKVKAYKKLFKSSTGFKKSMKIKK